MAIFADTPRWPTHGTVWGHLVSDTSIDELHDAARRAGLHPRSFDLDHYDWPVAARPALRAAGVTFVDGRELTHILIHSGLRIPLKNRADARAARTRDALASVGLRHAFTLPDGTAVTIVDAVIGPIGHADPLPPTPGHARVTTEQGEAVHVAVSTETPNAEKPRLTDAGMKLIAMIAPAHREREFSGQFLVRIPHE